MPRMNGYQLYQWVRENPKWVRIPFLFLSAHQPDSDIQLDQNLSTDDYLTKPIRTGDLISIVQSKLQHA
jgi:CheY-like chemotaxis protein